MRAQVARVLGQDLGLSLVAADAVAERGHDDDFRQYGAVIQGHGERVRNPARSRVVVGRGEQGIFDAGDALPEGLDHRRGGSLGAVGVVASFQAVEDEHGGNHVLLGADI